MRLESVTGKSELDHICKVLSYPEYLRPIRRVSLKSSCCRWDPRLWRRRRFGERQSVGTAHRGKEINK